MCPVCWMTAFASISMFVALAGAVIAMRDRWSLGIAALLGALSAAKSLQLADDAPQLITLAGCLLATRAGWVVAVGPDRIAWGELWVRAKARAASLCPARRSLARKTAESNSQMLHV